MTKQDIINKVQERIFNLRNAMSNTSDSGKRAQLDKQVQTLYRLIDFIENSNDKNAILSALKSAL